MTPRPLTPRQLAFGFTPVADPQLAPDGTRILYALRHARQASPVRAAPACATGVQSSHARVGGQASDLWLCDLDGENQRRLTDDGARSANGRFSPDGEEIAFVSDRDGGQGIYVLPLIGGAPRLVAHHSTEAAAGELSWSPLGSRIAYTALIDPHDPEGCGRADSAIPPVRVIDSLHYREDGRGFLEKVRRQVCLVDLATGERRRLTEGMHDYAMPRWSPNGRLLAASVCTERMWSSQLALIDTETGRERRVGAETGAVAYAAWAPDGGRLALCGQEQRCADGEHWDLFVYDLAAERLKRITHDLTCAIVSDPVWLDEKRLLLHAVRAGASCLYRCELETGELVEVVRFEALNEGLSVDGARRRAVQAYESLDEVGEIVIVDLLADAARVVTSYSRPVFAGTPPARWERLQVVRDGLTIDAWLLLPPESGPPRRHPIVLDVHGGPQDYYGHGFDIAQQCLATHGFLVVYANPRGSRSYGATFARKIDADWADGAYHDLLAVLDAVAAREDADADRVGIMGFSYGGYMTAWAIGQSDRFKAAVCGAPVFDLVSEYGTSDVNVLFSRHGWAGSPHERPEWYAAQSPSTFAHQVKTPTLILHGEADCRCPIGQSEQLFTALMSAGCKTRFVRYSGGSHEWFSSPEGVPEHRMDMMERTLRWFKSHLGEPR